MSDDSVLYFNKANITLSKCCSTGRTFAVTEFKISLYAWIAEQMIALDNHNLPNTILNS